MHDGDENGEPGEQEVVSDPAFWDLDRDRKLSREEMGVPPWWFATQVSRFHTFESKNEKTNSNATSTTWKLDEDVFSLLFTAKWKSWSYFYALIVFFFQLTLLFLIMYDLLVDAPTGNPLNVPPGIHSYVRAAQFFALLIALVFEDNDVIASLDLIGCYDTSVLEEFPEATEFRWYFAYVGRFVEGLGNLSVSFVLIVQSRQVIQLFFNFAAMQFVSRLDNVAFLMASKGYVTEGLLHATEKVKKLQFHRKSKAYWRRFGCFFLIFTGMVIGWGFITHWQKHGKYLCHTLVVQLGDEAYKDSRLEYFSGTYRIVPELIGGRAVYAEEDHWLDDHSIGGQRGILVYCEEEASWGFVTSKRGNNKSVCDSDTDESENSMTTGHGVSCHTMIEGHQLAFDPCDFILSSPKNKDNYDVTAMPFSEWSAWIGPVAPVSYFGLYCVECDKRDNSGQRKNGANPTCNYHGWCNSSKQCVCIGDWYGLTCELSRPFERIEVSEESSDGASTAPTTFGYERKYSLLKYENRTNSTNSKSSTMITNIDDLVLVRYRPVYMYPYDNGFDYIIFTGRRWVIGFSRMKPQSFVHKFLQNTTRFQWTSVATLPIIITEPSYRSTPVGVCWQEWLSFGKGDSDIGIATRISVRMLSPICNNDTNPCVGGTCLPDHTCDCHEHHRGALCHIRDTFGEGWSDSDNSRRELSSDESDDDWSPSPSTSTNSWLRNIPSDPRFLSTQTSSPSSSATATPSTNKNKTQCHPAELFVQLVIHTDDFPRETSWAIAGTNQGEIDSRPFNTFKENFVTFNRTFCLHIYDCYELVVSDSFGDGISKRGWYRLEVDDRVIKRGGRFTHSESTHFGSC